MKTQEWADNNNLKLNAAKSTENDLEWCWGECAFLPAPCPIAWHQAIRRTQNFRSNIDLTTCHLMYISTRSSIRPASLCMLFVFWGRTAWKVIRYGMYPVSTLVAKLTYASPSWWGYTSETQKQRLHRLLIKLQRCGFLHAQFESIAPMYSAADDALFRSILNNDADVHHPLLPPIRTTGYDLRHMLHYSRIASKSWILALRRESIFWLCWINGLF